MTVLKYSNAKLRITELIRERQLAVGDKLPSERYFAEQLGISIISIRRAMADLAEAGIIRKEPGIGTFFNGNLEMNLPYSQCALINIGDNAYPDSRRLHDFKTALQARRAAWRVVHLPRKVGPGHFDEIQGHDRIIVTGFLSKAWIEYIKSLDVPLLQIGESGDEFHLPRIRYNWNHAMAMIVDTFRKRGKKIFGALLCDPASVNSTRTIGDGLRKALGKDLDDRLILPFPDEQPIKICRQYLQKNLQRLEVLIMITGKGLPALFTPELHEFVKRGGDIVIVQEADSLPQDYLSLAHFHKLHFPESITATAVRILYEFPNDFFERASEFFLEPELSLSEVDTTGHK